MKKTAVYSEGEQITFSESGGRSELSEAVGTETVRVLPDAGIEVGVSEIRQNNGVARHVEAKELSTVKDAPRQTKRKERAQPLEKEEKDLVLQSWSIGCFVDSFVD